MRLTCAFLLTALLAVITCGYSPSDNEHVRFGAPGIKGRVVKKQGYVLLFDAIKKNPVWVSYHLKKENLITDDPKAGAFKADASLPLYEQVKRDEYGAKFEKCPMAPVIDMSYSKKTHDEAFLLSNVVQMDPLVKKNVWRPVEDRVRDLVKKTGEAWVVSGPVFEYGDKKIARAGSGRLAVPTGFYKVVLYQSKDGSFHSIGFYADNKPVKGKQPETMTSVADIESRTGLKFFTVLPQEVQDIIKRTSKDPNIE